MTQSHVVSDLFNVKNIATLKSQSSQSKSLKVVPFDRLVIVSC